MEGFWEAGTEPCPRMQRRMRAAPRHQVGCVESCPILPQSPHSLLQGQVPGVPLPFPKALYPELPGSHSGFPREPGSVDGNGWSRMGDTGRALGLGQLLSSKLGVTLVLLGEVGYCWQWDLMAAGLQMDPAGAELMMHPGKTQCGLGRKGRT